MLHTPSLSPFLPDRHNFSDSFLGSPALRARLIDAMEAATGFDSVSAWLDHVLREIINVIYGSEILPNTRKSEGIRS